jgi:mRNA interferase YafQ
MPGFFCCYLRSRKVVAGARVRYNSPVASSSAITLSFSEDDCTRQRGLKAVVQSSIERTVSGVRCTNDDLKPVLVALATDQPLDVRYRDHDLSGDWAGYRDECHIKPDLLLIYRKSDADTLRLARLGSHSELFG